VVAVLETVDLTTLRTNKVAVELSRNVERVSRLILELLANVENVLLGGVCLGLRALDLALTFVQLDVDIELVTELVDVLTATTNQVASELLREVEFEGEATLELVLLLLLDESKQVLDKGVDVVLRSTEVDSRLRCLLGSRRRLSGTTVCDLSWDLVLSERLVVTVNMLPDLVVELDRCLNVTGDDLLLATDQVENVLLRFLESALVVLGILLAGCLARQLVVRRRNAVLEHKQSRGVVKLIRNKEVHAILVTDLASGL
jgi:hypothetical protein